MRMQQTQIVRMAVLLALALPLAVAFAGSGKTYRWKDDKGRMHYSDVPAPKSEQVEVRTASGTQVAKPKESADAKPSNAAECQAKRDQLATYVSASKVTETDTLGNTRTYSDAEKQKLVERTQNLVKEACGNG